MRLSFLLWLGWFSMIEAAVIGVRSDDELRAALLKLQNGDTLQIAAGSYTSGRQVRGISGLTVEGLLSTRPEGGPALRPRFVGGTVGWQFSRCPGLRLRHLTLTGQSSNGLNLDDGGERTRPIEGITLQDIEITDIGPAGNHDGIKCSGLLGLRIVDCKLQGWGGQGIDFVGCHDSVIRNCTFIGKAGFTATAAIQVKGGSSNILVEHCQFRNAGERALNLGGSTGLDYFRPPLASYEAKGLTVRNCVIEGSLCAAAFVGVDGALFERNTILFPEKWVFRILQETVGARFVSCRDVTIRDNRIIFRRDQVQVDINLGANTAPETFVFQGNRWFAEDRPERSKPKLPSPETGGTYGEDPRP